MQFDELNAVFFVKTNGYSKSTCQLFRFIFKTPVLGAKTTPDMIHFLSVK